MSYQILDLDLPAPIGDAELSPGRKGFAVLVRHGGRPIGFFMQEAGVSRTIPGERLRELVARHCGVKLLQEAIRTELGGPERDWTPPSVSVVICTKDRPRMVRRCLASLVSIRAASPYADLEIMVLDNAPSDESTRQEATRLPRVRYVREPRPGLNFARNRALQEASGEIIAFIDDDAVADREWLAGLFEGLRENPGAVAVTGLVLPYELETPAQILFEKAGGFRRGFDKIRYDRRNERLDPYFPCGAGIFGAGCNMAFRREVVLQLGGFDEALDTGAPLPGGGDLDIFYRVVRAGHPLVYEPRLLVFHEHRRELTKLRRQHWTWGLGFMAFLAKSCRSDPAFRPRLRRTAWWWFGDQVRRLARRKHVLPAEMVAAEILGGVVGLAGTYARSRRRIERIRARHT